MDVAHGIRVIDTDTHLTEPHDLWTAQAPAALQDSMPHVVEVEGMPTWVIGDAELGRAGGGGVIGRDGSKINAQKGLFEWTIDDIHQGAYDPLARLEMMDEMGIWAEVLYPNVIGLGGQGIADVVKDEPFRLTLLQMYNDHMSGVQERSGHRLLPMGVLPSWSVDACVAEAERLDGLGFRGVNMTSDPQDLGAPDLASRDWDPLWATCAALELPVHFHIGASLTTMNFYGNYPWPSQQEDVALGIGGTLLFVGNARVVVNVICSGLLDRHPGAEDGVGRERLRLDPVHPRGARLRDGGERAPSRHRAQPPSVRVLQAPALRHDLVRVQGPGRTWSSASAKTTSCSRPTSPTPPACSPIRSRPPPRTWSGSRPRCSARS